MADSHKVFLYTPRRPCDKARKVGFFESLLNSTILASCGSLENSTDEVVVSCVYENNQIEILPENVACLSEKGKFMKTTLCRPPTCPLKYLSVSPLTPKALEDSNMQIRIASVLLLESIDQKILLTKRCPDMRAFPNVWVPPGGIVNKDERLERAALRETFEEVGLSFKKCQLHSRPKLLGLFESSYPLSFDSLVKLKKHDLVAYFTVKTWQTSSEISQELHLNPAEVEKAAWICPSLIKKVLIKHQTKHNPKFDCESMYLDLKCNVDCCCHNHFAHGAELKGNKTVVTDNVDVTNILQVYDQNGRIGERISDGTIYALKLWNKMTTKCCR